MDIGSDVSQMKERYAYRAIRPGVYQPSRFVQGAWSPQEQHMAPVAGLLAHEVEQFEPRPGMRIVKLGYEILGFLPLAETTVEVRVARPGKTIEEVEFAASIAGREVVRGTAWRLRTGDSSAVAGQHESPMPGPDQLPPLAMKRWAGGYIESLHLRGRDGEPGRNQAWVRSEVPLVQGVEVGPVAEFVRYVDTANGIAVRVDPARWMFPNVDLVVHLWRQPERRRPEPAWTGLDTRVAFGPDGVGLTSSVLHDLFGPVGRSEQVLTVRPLPD